MQMTETPRPSTLAPSAPKTNGHVNGSTKPNSSINNTEEEEHTPLENILAVSETVVRQAIDFVRDDLQSDEQLTFRSQYIPGSTIGASEPCLHNCLRH